MMGRSLFVVCLVLCAGAHVSAALQNPTRQTHTGQNNDQSSRRQQLLDRFDTDGDGELSRQERSAIVQARAEAEMQARRKRLLQKQNQTAQVNSYQIGLPQIGYQQIGFNQLGQQRRGCGRQGQGLQRRGTGQAGLARSGQGCRGGHR